MLRRMGPNGMLNPTVVVVTRAFTTARITSILSSLIRLGAELVEGTCLVGHR